MWAQLTKACLRLEEIETQLSQPETYDDPDLAASLNKEQKDLLPLVEAYRQHQKAQADLDGLADLCAFADRLEKATLDTIESGVMTKDLAALYEGEARAVNSKAFLGAIAERM